MTSTVSSGPYVANNSEVGNSEVSSNKRAKRHTSDDLSSGSNNHTTTTNADTSGSNNNINNDTNTSGSNNSDGSGRSTKAQKGNTTAVAPAPFNAPPVPVHALELGVKRPPSLLETLKGSETCSGSEEDECAAMRPVFSELVAFPPWRYVVEPTCADSSEEPRSPTPPPQDVAEEHQATTRATPPHPDNATAANTDQPQPRHPATEPGSSLFVAGLPSTVDDAALEILLSMFGRLICAKVALSPNTALSRGFAFVHYVTLAEADAARKALHGAAFPGHGGRLQIETSHRSPADHFQSATGSRVVMLRQVPTSCTAAEIQLLAGKHGEVVSCEMRSVPKGVEETSVTLRFRRSNDAAACVQSLHGKMPFRQCHLPFVARLVTAHTTDTKPAHGSPASAASRATTTTTNGTPATRSTPSQSGRSSQQPQQHAQQAHGGKSRTHGRSPAPNGDERASSTAPSATRRNTPPPLPPASSMPQHQPLTQQPYHGAATPSPLPPPFMWPGSYYPPPLPATTGGPTVPNVPAAGGFGSFQQPPLAAHTSQPLPHPGMGYAAHQPPPWGIPAPPMPPTWPTAAGLASQSLGMWPGAPGVPPPLPPAMMGPAPGFPVPGYPRPA